MTKYTWNKQTIHFKQLYPSSQIKRKSLVAAKLPAHTAFVYAAGILLHNIQSCPESNKNISVMVVCKSRKNRKRDIKNKVMD